MLFPNGFRMSKYSSLLCLTVGMLVLSGCMALTEQPKFSKPYDASPTFGTAAREILPEAVPVGFLKEDTLLFTGLVDGEPVDEFPMPVTPELLEAGQENFNAFCTPCHGYAGYGDGVISLEGFAQPASFHDQALVDQPVGYYVQVMTEGKNTMYSYAGRVSAENRWAIAAYIRALQLSQNVAMDELTPAIQERLAASEKDADGGNASQ